jgi:hypothetical protein
MAARRKPLVLARLVLLLILAVTLVMLLPRVYHVWAGDASTPTYTEVIVQEGDTLWSIAGRYASPNIDRRKAVYEIEVFNNLASVSIYPGQVIRVPVFPQ